MGSGILAGVDLQGAQGQEGQVQLALTLMVPCGRGPAAQEGGMDPQKHSVGCLRGAIKFVRRTGSLWDFGWGMGEGDGAGRHLCSPRH